MNLWNKLLGSAALSAALLAGAPALAQGTVNVKNLPTVVDTNAGAAGASTLRVVFANNQTVGLAAGTQLVGKFGIDQTTPGTTNAVAATNLPTTVDTNTGAAGASTLRVAIANAQTVGLAAGTQAIGALTASTPVASTSLETSHVICGAPCQVTDWETNVDGTITGAYFVTILNATSDPGNGAITPVKCYGVQAGLSQVGAIYGPGGGLSLSTGAVIVITSSGCFTETGIGAHGYISASKHT